MKGFLGWGRCGGVRPCFLIQNKAEQILYFYNASGLVTEVWYEGSPKVKFMYNDRNHRVKKESYHNRSLLNSTFYVRDVAGQVMAIYTEDGSQPQLVEQPIYGAGRIGVQYTNGLAVYELTDHLGNVRALFTKESATDSELEGYTDYYPFGMPMPSRQMTDANQYRYAFQGQEKDEETGKEAFELRLWDSRIGRWLTTDPYNEFHSPYLGMGNNPVGLIDPDGGRTNNPIYGSDGKFRGVDNKGLQGDAIIYDGEFTNGMAQSEILNNGGVFLNDFLNTFPDAWNSNAVTSIQEHIGNIPNRPDFDGIVTEAEADNWRKIGNGQPLFVDFSKLDFKSSRLSVQDLEVGKYQLVNFFNGVNIHAFKDHVIYRPAKDNTLSWVHGTLDIILLDPNKGTISINQGNGYFDIYDFHRLNVFAPSGTDFNFYGYGVGKININPPPFPEIKPNFRPFGL